MGTERRRRFESQVLAHLDAAYGLARWLLHDEQRAADATQESCLRAWRHFDGMLGDSPKAWFLAIVRNACHDEWRSGQVRAEREANEAAHLEPAALDDEGATLSPETLAERASNARRLHACLAALDTEHREVLVLREFEEMSYREISIVIGVPIGTVMSRLSRGRDRLAALLGAGRQRRTG